MYSGHGEPNPLDLFFTQRVQTEPQRQGDRWVFPWVTSGEDQATCLEKPRAGAQNILHLSVSDDQPEGELVVESSEGGELGVDASCGCPINELLQGPGGPAQARADRSWQWVERYVFRIKTPIGEGATSTYQFPGRERTWNYPHKLGRNNVRFLGSPDAGSSLTVGEGELDVSSSGFSDDYRDLVPGTVDASTYYGTLGPPRREPQTVFLNRWWYENRDRREPRTTPAERAPQHWDTLTVDDSYQVNTQLPGGDTVDRTLLMLPRQGPLDPWLYDSGWHARRITNINIENVPQAPYTASLYDRDGRLLSQTHIPLPERGWLPASDFRQMDVCRLPDLALGLLALHSQRRWGLCEQAVNELLYRWQQAYGNRPENAHELQYLSRKALPEVIYRFENEIYPGERRTRSLCWLGLALLHLCWSWPEKPKHLAALLKQIALFVAYCVDTGAGRVYEGFDANEFLIGETTLATTCWAAIFLNAYLQFDYQPLLHHRLARIENLLHNDWRSQISQTQPEQRLDDACAYLAYLCFCQDEPEQRGRAEALAWHIAAWIQESAPNKEPVYLFCHLVQHYLPDVLERDQWRVARYITRIGPFAGYPTWNSYPKLSCTAWLVLEQQGMGILPPRRFHTYHREMDAFRVRCYQMARYLWPYGYNWTDEAKEQARGTAIGSLLLAMCDPMYGWFGLFALLRDGKRIDQAQGWVLDLWADDVGVPRQPLEPDDQLKQRIQKALAPKDGKRLTLAREIEREWQPGRWWEHSFPREFWVDTAQGRQKVVWDESPDSVERIPREPETGRAYIYLQPDASERTYLDRLLPGVTVETGKVQAGAVEALSRHVPVGTPLELVCLVGREDRHPVDTACSTQSLPQTVPYTEQELPVTQPWRLLDWAETGEDWLIEEEKQDLSVYRMALVPAGTTGWKEDGTSVGNAVEDTVLSVPPGIPIQFGNSHTPGVVTIPPQGFYQNLYEELPIYLYSRRQKGLQLTPDRTALVRSTDDWTVGTYRLVYAPAGATVYLETGEQLDTTHPHLLAIPPHIPLKFIDEPPGLWVRIDDNCYAEVYNGPLPVDLYYHPEGPAGATYLAPAWIHLIGEPA